MSTSSPAGETSGESSAARDVTSGRSAATPLWTIAVVALALGCVFAVAITVIAIAYLVAA